MNPQPFAIPGPCAMNTPFDALHVWQWMNTTNPQPLTLAGYLESLGFVRGRDHLDPEQAQVLRYAMSHWAWLRARKLPT